MISKGKEKETARKPKRIPKGNTKDTKGKQERNHKNTERKPKRKPKRRPNGDRKDT